MVWQRNNRRPPQPCLSITRLALATISGDRPPEAPLRRIDLSVCVAFTNGPFLQHSPEVPLGTHRISTGEISRYAGADDFRPPAYCHFVGVPLLPHQLLYLVGETTNVGRHVVRDRQWA